MTYFANSGAARRRLRRATVAAFVGALAALAGCDVSDALDVRDPDIINPDDVQSAAGAEGVRLGAMARLNAATSGVESYFLLGGMMADEWNNGDTFIERQTIDQRNVPLPAFNTFLTTANRNAHRARLAAELAVGLLREFSPTGPAWKPAEMYFVQAYTINMLAEHHCNGLVFSTVIDGVEQFGTPVSTQAAFQRALATADSGLALITGSTTDDVRVRNALSVTKGRILVNLGRYADAATAVASVPTSFRYRMFHSQTTNDNQIWAFNNSARRYSVSNLEGGTGLNFATANDPRLPICQGGDVACRAIGVTQVRRDDNTSAPLYIQMLWTARDSSVTIVSGVEARLIEAEAKVATDAAGALTILNNLRAATGTGSGGVAGLSPLTDAGSPAARVDQLFRERAFWLFSRGHRLGDLRRLVRQYSRAANTVYPNGAWHKGGTYGADLNFTLPEAERNNANTPQTGDLCIDRNA